ncbi:MAG TPA: hypothetical protein VNN07_04330, partial [Candidatus Tectomicrobia bacterium]|nr:hypothetical protein [Candidatus Tectomicrobia bacterium]
MAVRRLLVLTASELEARTLARTLGLAPAPGPVAAFTGGRVRVVCVGVAAARIERALPVDSGSTLVVSAGVCGALDPSLPVGALVVPETVAGTSGERWIAAAMPPLTARGTLLAVSEVVETAAAKSRLWMESGALALDMESGEICRWAAAVGVPAGVVRGVSDAADRGVPGALA